MNKLPTPCIDVCKFKRSGHCIGCSMTKTQKKMGKNLKKPKERAAFLALVMAQQQVMGHYTHWRPAFDRLCQKKGLTPPKWDSD